MSDGRHHPQAKWWISAHYVHKDCKTCKKVERLGYLAWHARAEKLAAEGKKQAFCKLCKRYRWPQEIK